MSEHEDNDYYYTYRIIAVAQDRFLLIKLIHSPGGILSDPRVHQWMNEAETTKFMIYMQRRGFHPVKDGVDVQGEIAAFI